MRRNVTFLNERPMNNNNGIIGKESKDTYKIFNWSTVHTLQGSPQKKVLTVLTNFF